jgi:hypothetical protein
LNGIVLLHWQDGLYRSDGTAAGTYKISQARPTVGPLRVGNAAYFIEALAGSDILYRTDGTAAGTVEVQRGLLFPDTSGRRPSMARLGDTLYFQLPDSSGNGQILATTGPGDRRSVAAAGAAGLAGAGLGLAQVAGKLFFPGRDESGGFAVWALDGATGNVARVPGTLLPAGAETAMPSDLTAVGGSLYFTRSLTGG